MTDSVFRRPPHGGYPDTPRPQPAGGRYVSLVDGPRGPEFVAQPNYARLGLDDPESRN